MSKKHTNFIFFLYSGKSAHIWQDESAHAIRVVAETLNIYSGVLSRKAKPMQMLWSKFRISNAHSSTLDV